MDHLIPRSQGGPYVPANGWPLCGPWSVTIPGGHHLAKTDHRLLIRPEWLDSDMIAWLAQAGHAWWTPDGEVHGTHRRIFTSAQPYE